MLSKIKIAHARGEDNENSDKTQIDSEISRLKCDSSKVVEKVYFDATQVEDFLTSEYFGKEEVFNLGCWDICSTQSSPETSSISNGPCRSRPITALALMLISQYSSLPRSMKIR